MADNCNTTLPNLGGKCRFNAAEIIQLIFVSTFNDSGTLNYISLATATAKANWQAKFNVFGFSATSLNKFVPSGRLYNLVPDMAEDGEIDEAGYYEKLRDGDYTITAQFNNPAPYFVAQLKKLEGQQVSIYMIDANGKIIGTEDGTNLYPIRLMNFGASNYKLKTYDAQAMSTLKMRLQTPADINSLWMVELADGNPNSSNDFYALQNCTAVIGTPATTGCIATVTLDETGEPVEGLAANYLLWKFKNLTTSALVSLAASGSVAESATIPGQYTVNESALLTSGVSYGLQISVPMFDVAQATVTVP